MKVVLLVNILFWASVNAQEINFLKLHSSFSSNPGEASKKYFGKSLNLKAKVTGISRTFDSKMYIISLNEGKGKVYVQPSEISEVMKKKIYDLRNKDKKESEAELTVTLVKTEGGSLLFNQLKSIKLIAPKKPEKKEAEKKKKQPEKKKKKK